jgi:glycosyltransferase involved in cell wall biosynthesis
MAAVERRLADRFDQVTVATQGEADALATIGVRGQIDWFPNGVDVEYFHPTREPYDANLITFVGRMDYFPNEQCMVAFCGEVWPRLRRAQPCGCRSWGPNPRHACRHWAPSKA